MKVNHEAKPNDKMPTVEEQLAAIWKGGAEQEAMRQRVARIEAKKQQGNKP